MYLKLFLNYLLSVLTFQLILVEISINNKLNLGLVNKPKEVNLGFLSETKASCFLAYASDLHCVNVHSSPYF